MDLRKDVEFHGPVVTGFTAIGFKVADERFDEGLLLSPEQALPWTTPVFSALALVPIFDALKLSPKPEFLLFGSGSEMLQPPASFRREADAAGLGIEVMDSRAAARTWGLLRAEERWIIAALMPLR